MSKKVQFTSQRLLMCQILSLLTILGYQFQIRVHKSIKLINHSESRVFLSVPETVQFVPLGSQGLSEHLIRVTRYFCQFHCKR